MDVIQSMKDFCTEFQKDERYLAFWRAKEATDNNQLLQDKVGEFNLKRMNLNEMLSKADKDMDKIKALDTEIRSLYDEVMSMPDMIAYNETKAEVDNLVQHISGILSMAVNGEDPQTYDPNAVSCGGDCAGCAGCH